MAENELMSENMVVPQSITQDPVLETVDPVLNAISVLEEEIKPVKPITIEPVTISKEVMSSILKRFGTGRTTSTDTGGETFTPTSIIVARQIAFELQGRYPSLITYEGLLDGTAPWFNTFDRFKNRPPNERKLNHDNILTLFARDSLGRPLVGEEMNSVWEGFKRQITPSAAGLAGIVGGVNTAIKIPGGPVARFWAALGLGTVGLFGGEISGKKLTDIFMGEERVFTPGQKARYESGKTLASFLPYIMPSFYIPKNVDLGGGTLLKNIYKNAERVTAQFKNGQPLSTVLNEEELATQGVRNVMTGKYTLFSPFKRKTKDAAPFNLRVVAAVERMLSGYSQSARKNPVISVTTEGAAALTAAAAAGIVEEAFPERSGPRLAGEMFGAAIPSVLGTRFLRYIPKINAALKKSVVQPFKDEGAIGVWDYNKDKLQDIRKVFSTRRDKKTVERIISQLTKKENYEDGIPPTAEELQTLFALLEAKTVSARETALGRPMTEAELLNFEHIKDWTSADASAGSGRTHPVILALQAAAESSSPGLIEKRRDQQILALDNYEEIIKRLVQSGDPSLMKVAAEMTNDAFVLGHTASINDATERVLAAMERVKGTGPENNKELGIKLNEAITGVLSKARNMERTLWQGLDNITLTEFRDVDNNIVETPNFISGWDDLMPLNIESKELLTSKLYSLNNFVERKRADLGLKVLKKGEKAAKYVPITMQELREVRSTALSLVRENISNPNVARVAGEFAESLLDDMQSLPQGTLFGYDGAVAYSKSLNDVFTRTYKAPLNMKTRQGGQRIPPELLVSNLMGGTFESQLLRQAELEEVAVFAQKQGLEGFESDVVTFNGVRDNMLRNFVSRKFAVDPETGAVNPEALSKWMNDPVIEEMLSMPVFQSLKEDLSEASTATTLFKGVQARFADEQKTLRRSISFLNFLPQSLLPTGVKSKESVAKIMGLAIESDFPTNSLNNILSFVNGGKSQKMAGVEISGLKGLNSQERLNARAAMKSAIIEYSFLKADANSGAFSPTVMYKSIFNAMPNTGFKRSGANIGGTSLSDWMTKNEIMSSKDLGSMKSMLNEMVKYEAMDAAGKLTDDVLAGDTSAALDLYIKLAGSKLGATAAGALGAGADSLIVRSAGVRFLTQIIKDVPKSLDMAFAGKLFENPELMAAMLRASKSGKLAAGEKQAIGSRLMDLLAFYGFRETFPLIGSKARETGETIIGPTIETIKEKFIQPENSTQPDMDAERLRENNLNKQNQLKTSFLQRQPSGVPPTNISAAPASGPVKVDRARFAALFPEDRALIEGIGSLQT